MKTKLPEKTVKIYRKKWGMETLFNGKKCCVMGFFLNQVCKTPLKRMRGGCFASSTVAKGSMYHPAFLNCEDKITWQNDKVEPGMGREEELKKLFKEGLNTELVFID